MNFRALLEAVKEKTFNIKNGTVIRAYHLRTKRVNDNKPKDFAMTKTKYEKVIMLSLEKMTDDGVYSIEWTLNDKKSVISLKKDADTFIVFGAIMNAKLSDSPLYSAAERVIYLGNINF